VLITASTALIPPLKINVVQEL